MMALLQGIDGFSHLFTLLSEIRVAYSVLEMLWFLVSVGSFIFFPLLRNLSLVFLIYILFSFFMASFIQDFQSLEGQFLLPSWFGLVAIIFALNMARIAFRIYQSSYAGKA